MNITRLFTASALALALSLLGGCVTPVGTNPNPVAYKPKNPSNVQVKVSLSKQQVYVMEGDQPLLVAATCVGVPGKPTPTGTFHVTTKIAHKRSASYGFYAKGGTWVPAKAGAGSGAYVGYPMPYWVEFAPQYGFHLGCVWPVPHSHGCLRLHKNVAPKFYALVHEGTPVNIAVSQPEDQTIGKSVPRPVDFADPDPDASILCSDRVFYTPQGELLVDRP
jgi:hypothetical protein